MNIWDLFLDYCMFVIAGLAGGFSLAIWLDTETISKAKPFLFIFSLFFLFLIYFLLAKIREISKKKKP